MAHPKEEKTVLIIKPDGVKRGLVGEIIKRVETRGLKIIALQMIWATKKQMDNHYPKDEVWTPAATCWKSTAVGTVSIAANSTRRMPTSVNLSTRQATRLTSPAPTTLTLFSSKVR